MGKFNFEDVCEQLLPYQILTKLVEVDGWLTRFLGADLHFATLTGVLLIYRFRAVAKGFLIVIIEESYLGAFWSAKWSILYEGIFTLKNIISCA